MRATHIAAAVLGAAVVWIGADTRSEITESKRLLIRELLEISGGGAAAEQVAQVFLAQIQYVYGAMVAEALASESELTPEQKQRLREQLGDFDAFAAAFSAKFPERIDLAEVLEGVYVPLYDKYFDESELREIVSFYRTPTGRKTITAMPALMREGLEDTAAAVEPKVMNLVGEILAERRAELFRSLEAAGSESP